MNRLVSIRVGALLKKKVWVLTAMVVLLLSSAALAAGRVQWKSRSVKESDRSWKVDVKIFLSKAPDTSLVPVRFSFTPMTYFERALVDNHKEPVTRVVQLYNRQPLVEGVDIGFLDPSTGKVEPRTQFTFRVTRDRGYEAGDYDVEIKDARTDQSIGGKQRITLEGENEVIDRRAMDFSAAAAPKKEKKESDEPPKKAQEYSPDDPAYWEGGPKEPEPKEEELPPPASMKDHPGACGCRAVGMDNKSNSPSNLWWVLSSLALVVGVRRRLR